eukprot:TRINITY_DN8713_c0_g1_i1.p1 TRINITY_DN8713_c0_g1~~TRINITY_DN8713_c0_g1_i1.p1  ORF type:complete len:139 (+),score=26.22 TRINITY_DN8713_c0_g1_i1:104-520(+)
MRLPVAFHPRALPPAASGRYRIAAALQPQLRAGLVFPLTVHVASPAPPGQSPALREQVFVEVCLDPNLWLGIGPAKQRLELMDGVGEATFHVSGRGVGLRPPPAIRLYRVPLSGEDVLGPELPSLSSLPPLTIDVRPQ